MVLASQGASTGERYDMKLVVEMEIESDDYDGRCFMNEIKKLIEDIDSASKLVSFKMREKSPASHNDERTVNWSESYGYES